MRVIAARNLLPAHFFQPGFLDRLINEAVTAGASVLQFLRMLNAGRRTRPMIFNQDFQSSLIEYGGWNVAKIDSKLKNGISKLEARCGEECILDDLEFRSKVFVTYERKERIRFHASRKIRNSNLIATRERVNSQERGEFAFEACCPRSQSRRLITE